MTCTNSSRDKQIENKGREYRFPKNYKQLNIICHKEGLNESIVRIQIEWKE